MNHDIHITDGGQPIAEQLYEHFRSKILSGEFKAGDKLPSANAIAEELAISAFPAVSAYRKLERDGLVRLCNKGSFVLDYGTVLEYVARKIDEVIEIALQQPNVQKEDISKLLESFVEKYR